MKKLYEKYAAENGISAKISPTEITLKTSRGQQQFMFRKSRPEVVEKIANIMLAAVAISKKQNKKDFIIPAKN